MRTPCANRFFHAILLARHSAELFDKGMAMELTKTQGDLQSCTILDLAELVSKKSRTYASDSLSRVYDTAMIPQPILMKIFKLPAVS